MEIRLVSSPKVNTYMSDRIKVAEYHAIYINFPKLVKAKDFSIRLQPLFVLFLHICIIIMLLFLKII